MNQRIYFLLKLFLVHLIFFTLFRVGFYFIFEANYPNINPEQLRKAFYLGTKFDVRLAFVLIAPVWLLGYIPFLNPLDRGARIWRYFYDGLFLIWFTLYATDIGYYAYLSSRINGTIFHFFENMFISAQMVWQTYPVGWVALGLAVALIIFNFILKKLVFFKYRHRNLKLSSQVFSFVFFIAIFVGGVYGKFSTFPLRWSEAFFSQNSFISALALNPITYLLETYKYQKGDFDKKKVQEYYPLIANYLGVPIDQQNVETLNFKRHIKPEARFKTEPNVIFVMMESLASFKTNLGANKLQATPTLKALADDGLYFPRFYVPSEATARSQFGIMTGVPDVSSYKTASRNPLIVDQNVILNFFKGYHKLYFLGGNANWGQIRSVFTHNIEGIEVVEEGQFDSPVMDVWGISDLDLFKEADKKLKTVKAPFVAVIQMASFHRPYTIPSNSDDFKPDTSLTEEEAIANGFISVAEYNSLRFADYSIHRFLEIAKKSPYYENTIFVFWGDHGLTDNGVPEHVPKIERLAETSKFHVPLIFYGPKFFLPQVDTRIAWQMDVLPTVASMLGVEYINSSFGRDLTNPKYDSSRAAFTYTYYYQPAQFSLIKDKYLYYVRGEKEFLLDLETDQDLSSASSLNEVTDLKVQMPELAKEMRDLSHGIYETSKYMLYNNPQVPLPEAPAEKSKPAPTKK